MIVNSKFISFNILANRFTYFNKPDHIIETKDVMKDRYNSIIKLLLSLRGDIYFIQEVDNFFYDLLFDSPFRKKYFISFSYCTALKHESNKSDLGLIIMINKRQFIPVNNNINSLQNVNVLEKINMTFKSNDKYALSIHFTHLVFVDNIEIGNKKKLSQLLVVQNRDSFLILINCHFEGRPHLADIRLKQFQYCLSIAYEIKKKLNKPTFIIIGGDFNEPNGNIIEDKYCKSKVFDLKLYNKNKDNTSFSKYERNGNEPWMSIDRREKIDYIIGTSNIKVLEEKLLPKNEIVYPDWNKKFDIKYNWSSDHKVIYLLLEYENNNSKKTKKKKTYKLL